MIKRFFLVIIFLIPLQALGQQDALISLGQKNAAHLNKVLNCVYQKIPTAHSKDILIDNFKIYRTPRNISIFGAKIEKDNILSWEVVFEFADDKLFAFDAKPPAKTQTKQPTGQFGQFDSLSTQVPFIVYEALIQCDVEWMGFWEIKVEIPNYSGEDLLPPLQ